MIPKEGDRAKGDWMQAAGSRQIRRWSSWTCYDYKEITKAYEY